MALPPVGLGTMGIDDAAVVATALDVGCGHLDTAQIYENEAVIGGGLARSRVPRDEVTLATRVRIDSLVPEAVHRTTAESLERLDLDSIDLVYVHRPVDTYDPETTLGAFDELYDAGVTDGVGLSNCTVAKLTVAQNERDAPIAAHQDEYHPLFRRVRHTDSLTRKTNAPT